MEIDALVAVWLGVSADALVAMYKARFPIMQDFDSVTWFDANERKIAGNRYTYGFGQTKEHYEHFLAYQNKERSEPPRATPPLLQGQPRGRDARGTRVLLRASPGGHRPGEVDAARLMNGCAPQRTTPVRGTA
ncbi:hypothetical protein GTX14_16580 [Streptomyces sp. SID4944]|nr:hypothetical protein [Streptomyces sp. SID4944]